jgi:hypothetical protein
MAGMKKITHRDLIALLSKGVHDDAFGKHLMADPKKALEGEGFEATDQAVRFFKSVKDGDHQDAARRATEHRDAIDFAGDM